MKKVLQFLKKETVLSIAWAAAIISAFWVPPSADYISYIDFRSLGILWSLMVVMEGLKVNGFFSNIGTALLKKTHKAWQLAAVLVFLCFFLSMLITNDVALITFVPFAIYMLQQTGREDLLIPVIVLQTLAANLGSMLTPVGNPQNLYLYGLSGMPFGSFVWLMLPYTGLTLVLLTVSICFLKGKNEIIQNVNTVSKISAGRGADAYAHTYADNGADSNAGAGTGTDINTKTDSDTRTSYQRSNIIYGCLFIFALLVVMRLVPYYILIAAVLVIVFFINRKSLLSVDYALLFTFIGFFIFTGNLGNIPAISAFLTKMISGHEVITSVAASQAISNVPAALLLSGFTDRYSDLIIGTNLGGLGTLIASMASLISFKALAHNYNHLKGRYFLVFTIMNVLYLAVLLVFWYLFVL